MEPGQNVLQDRNHILRILTGQDFISLFIRMSCHQISFETINETTSKMNDFILEFHNTKFYVVLLVCM
jgi:hypothetical protein